MTGGGTQDAPFGEPLVQHLSSVGSRPLDEHQEAARKVGESMRVVINRLTATTAPVEVLAEAADRMAEVASLLDGYGSNRPYEGFAEGSGAGHDVWFFDWSPLLGRANPLAPPIRVEVEGDVLVGRTRFGAAYEGPPGCVHGGFVAAAFDDVLGLTQSLSGKLGMTGTLTVRYRRPTPLHTDVRFEGRLEGVEGRKVITSGQLLVGGALCAEATGVFVTVPPERFAQFAPNRRAADEATGAGKPASDGDLSG